MKSVFHCKSCGFVSTYRQVYAIFRGVLVCKECKEAYGMDQDVTRWVNDAVENNTKEGSMKNAKPKARRNVRRDALARAKRQMEFFPRNSRQWREAKQAIDFWS